MKYKVLASVISLPGEPAYQGAIVSDEQFNDADHIQRLLDISHIEVYATDTPRPQPVQPATANGKRSNQPAKAQAASVMSHEDMVKAAENLGIVNARSFDEEQLKAAIEAVS